VSSIVQRAGTRFHHPVASTAATPPRKPPYQTNPPRRSSASHSPVSSTYQIFAPTMPPSTAANTMSAAYSSAIPRRCRSTWIAHPAMRNATIIISPYPVTCSGPRWMNRISIWGSGMVNPKG
jgi:hypothetical protein